MPKNMPENPLLGSLMYLRHCRGCQEKSGRIERFVDLSLTLPEARNVSLSSVNEASRTWAWVSGHARFGCLRVRVRLLHRDANTHNRCFPVGGGACSNLLLYKHLVAIRCYYELVFRDTLSELPPGGKIRNS